MIHQLWETMENRNIDSNMTDHHSHKKFSERTGETVFSGQCLPFKHESLHFISTTQTKITSICLGSCILGAGEAEIGGP